jgi:hypothetical protein
MGPVRGLQAEQHEVRFGAKISVDQRELAVSTPFSLFSPVQDPCSSLSRFASFRSVSIPPVSSVVKTDFSVFSLFSR